MRNSYATFFAFVLVFAFVQTGFGQQSQNPFDFKKKNAAVSGQSTGIQPAPLSNTLPVSSGRMTYSYPVINYKTSSFVQPNTIVEEHFEELRHDQNGLLIMAESKTGYGKYFNARSDESTLEACYAFLDEISKAMRIDQPAEEFAELANWEDEIGMLHLKMQQYFNGVKVYGGQLILHGSFGMINRMNGTYFPTPQIANLNPNISSEQAIDNAINDLMAHTQIVDFDVSDQEFLDYHGPESELVIYHHKRNLKGERLTWNIHIRPNMLEHWIYFVDAQTGEIINKYNNTCSDGPATAQAQDLNGVSQTIHTYELSGQFYMMDASRPMYNPGQSQLPDNPVGAIWTLDAGNTSMQNLQVSHITSPNNNWNNPTAVSAHNSAAITYEYFKNTHGRNSIDGQGGTIISIINVTEDNGSGLDNAFWNGKAMFYGNGNQVFLPLAKGLDVGAHEMAHGVTQHTANLEYQDQSGAINEAMSDIAGAMVDREDWQLGEDVVPDGSQHFPTGAMRDMQNPHNGGSGLGHPAYQPKHTDEMYTGNEDNGGVHINSGIINHAYYQLAESISKNKAEKLYYRALANYMTKSSQFIDCRLAFEQAAKDLYGDGSAELNAVVTAFFNVGIGDQNEGGDGSGPPGELPVNPGQDYIIFVDTNPGDPTDIYVSNTVASEFYAVTETDVLRKPSITDDGSAMVFVTGNNTMNAVDLTTSQFEEWELSSDPFWDNVAAAKDGRHIGAVSVEVDSSVWVYNFEKQQWAKFKLYNPSFSEGAATYNVLYADALEFDYSGEYIIYDAYNSMQNESGEDIDYWDMGIIRVWNNATNDWGDGEIFKLYASLPEGVNIGNPSLSKNSPYILAFDYFDNTTGETWVLANNLETGEIGEVYQNEVLGFPNYSKKDDKMVFTAISDAQNEVIGLINMKSDKINPQGNASLHIDLAKWPVWFAQGTRNLTSVDEVKETDYLTAAFPNPFNNQLTLTLELPQNAGYDLQLYNTFGQMVRQTSGVARQQVTSVQLPTGDLPAGTYVVKVSSEGAITSRVVVKASQ